VVPGDDLVERGTDEWKVGTTLVKVAISASHVIIIVGSCLNTC